MLGKREENIQKQKGYPSLGKIERLHPYKMLAFLGMVISFLILAFMIIAFLISKPEIADNESFSFPKPLIIGMVLILLSTLSISRLLPSFESENIRRMFNSLVATSILALLFVGCQLLGWLQLEQNGPDIFQDPSIAFLYIIFGLHAAHLVTGLSFLTYFLIYTFNLNKDPVRSLIAVTNPYQRVKIEMFVAFWYFFNFFWMVMFFFMLFTF
ncbi:cytochrome C oxidase subunit III [Fulvivirgaceae bacterium BMA10]|uniref:Cytochrome C oxidase subunit III n=1 Tax=Splendidivirga corallicola TaxID=3051826 RepID=A0ABT8KPU9_9BACT|nr:cytochrome C oxidase subunit III [Fulvivirgaceae bacterium BMA10]